MQKVDLEASFIKCTGNENCGLPDLFTDYQIRHLGNPSGLSEILLDPPLACTSEYLTNLQMEFVLFLSLLRVDLYAFVSVQDMII